MFVPGARVDSRAYAHILRPLAEAGYLVAVLKEPFGFAILDPNHGKKVLDLHPEISHWVVGGHSLGGTVAASLADDDERVEGLVLLASYPADPIIRNDLKVASISGTADGLVTPADIEASRAKLPPDTTFVVIDGAVHSSFGDYGEQPGDGIPTIDRTAAQAEIDKAALALVGVGSLLRHQRRRSSPPRLTRRGGRSLLPKIWDMSETGLKLAQDKMAAAGISQQAIDVFTYYYGQLEEGVSGFIPEDTIGPLTDPPMVSESSVSAEAAAAPWGGP